MCIRISVLLHALVNLFSADGAPPDIGADGESSVPVTSLACRWVQLRKQKEKLLKWVKQILRGSIIQNLLNTCSH